MIKVYAGAENIISSLGFNAEENIRNILNGTSGISIDTSQQFTPANLPLSLVPENKLQHLSEGMPERRFTRIEKMLILSVEDTLRQSNVLASSSDTLFILTTTKGNISLLNPNAEPGIDRDRIYLSKLARFISGYFKNPNKPVIVSNACVSGVVGIVYASRYIRSGKYRNVIVTGGDLISEFIVSGFQSFQSLSMQACRPFDRYRDGLTLGEGCGTILLSDDPQYYKYAEPLMVLGGAGSNDANHISGPSRTGEGLQIAIRHALELSGLGVADIDSISAHGTATDYNDEMEAKAFSSAGLENVPVNSYKGYIGHTLGAAGVIESAISIQSMRKNLLIASKGYGHSGVSKNINIIGKTVPRGINTCLKTASGFGGSNAAIIFKKQGQ